MSDSGLDSSGGSFAGSSASDIGSSSVRNSRRWKNYSSSSMSVASEESLNRSNASYRSSESSLVERPNLITSQSSSNPSSVGDEPFDLESIPDDFDFQSQDQPMDVCRSYGIGNPVASLQNIPRIAKRKHATEIHEGYKLDCANITTLRLWLEYEDYSLKDDPDNYAMYIEIGEELIITALQCVYDKSDSLMRHIFGEIRPSAEEKRKNIDIRADQCVFLLALVNDKLVQINQVLCEGYPGEIGDIATTDADTGWSPASVLYKLALKLRYFLAMVHSISQLYTNSPASLKELREIPFEPMIKFENTKYDAFLDSNLRLPASDLCLKYKSDGLFLLWPDVPIGEYLQSQIYLQLMALSMAWCSIDPNSHDVENIVDALETRMGELLTIPSNRAFGPYSSCVEAPLDMHPTFMVPTKCEGVPDDDNPDYLAAGKKVKALENNMLDINVSDQSTYTLGRRFIGEILGLILPMRRAMFLAKYYVEPARTQYSRDAVMEIVDHLVHLMCDKTEHYDKGHGQITFSKFRGIVYELTIEDRNKIADDKFNDNVVTTTRRMLYPFGLPEKYAYIPRNLHCRGRDINQEEVACIPPALLRFRAEEWPLLHLSTFERTPLFPRAAADNAMFCFIRNLGFQTQGHGEIDWYAEYVVKENDWESLHRRMSLDPSPFVIQIGATLYVRRKRSPGLDASDKTPLVLQNYMLKVNDAMEAFCVWLLIMLVDYNCVYKNSVKWILASHWITFINKVLKLYDMRNAQLSKVDEVPPPDIYSSDSDGDANE